MINVSVELEGYNREKTMSATENIYQATQNVFKMAKELNITTIERLLIRF
ncbi:MAG: hypothetical protein R2850_04125 [Bacteroidia bacterium]